MITTSLALTDAAAARIHREREKRGDDAVFLRLSVEGGGCSGFQYVMGWENAAAPDDIAVGDGLLRTDPVSWPFLEGAIVDFAESLMGSDFKIINPNATSGCGCGTSFSFS